MSWRAEWKAISDRIEGLMEAGCFFVQMWVSHSSDSYGTVKKVLLPNARDTYQCILRFKQDYSQSLPKKALDSLEQFTDESNDRLFKNQNIDGIEGLKLLLPSLVSFRSEFTYLLSDIQAIATRITERAFIHLQRCIIVDPYIKERWFNAFHNNEPACERLGAAHLLLHGIWAFKASAEGERTDLVLGEPLKDLSQVESSAEALVLTEWKLIRKPEELKTKVEDAYKQASIYSCSSMAGFELSSYRYLVFVSQERLNMPPDKPADEVIYRHINIAVEPKPPSKG